MITIYHNHYHFSKYLFYIHIYMYIFICIYVYIFVLSETKNSRHINIACHQNVLNLYLDKEHGVVHVQSYVYNIQYCILFLFFQLECSDRHLSLVSLSSHMSCCKDCLWSILEDRKYTKYIT